MSGKGTVVGLAEEGEARIGWIRSRMHLLEAVREEFARTRPFEGKTIGVGLHTEPKTAVLFETLAAGGARVLGTGNHGSTQDDVVAALGAKGIELYGKRDDTFEEHRAALERTVDAEPDILLDNGADLIAIAVQRGHGEQLIGATEETTSGGFRLREEFPGRVTFPVIVINDSPLKAIAENRHAVGQSTVESIMRITNLQVPGRRFVVAGYGWVGRGVAQYLRVLGGKVAVVEPDELKAFEAAYDGFRVAPMTDLASWADMIVTATGRAGVVGPEVFDLLQDGVVLGNVGHFPWEIDVAALKASAVSDRGGEPCDRGAADGRQPQDRAPCRRADVQPRRREPEGQLDRVDGHRVHAAGALARADRDGSRLARRRSSAGAGRHQPPHRPRRAGGVAQRPVTGG